MTDNPSRPLPFVNIPVDFLLIGGLSIIHYAFYSRGFTLPQYLMPNAAATAALLVWVINWPHFAATSYRLYHSKENIRQFPVTALVVPLLILGLMSESLTATTTLAPWLIKLFLIWSPYHFSAQTLGITLLYARRSGLLIGSITRRFISLFIFLTFLGPALRAETFTNVPYYGIAVPSFGLPKWGWNASISCMEITGAIALILLLRACWLQKKMRPSLLLFLLVPAVAQFLWFVPGSGVPGFVEFVPGYHSLQYLLIAWAMHLKERLDMDKLTPSRRFVALESIKWGVLNVALGALLFYGFPRLMHGLYNVDLFVATGIVIAGVQIHHFFVDGVIWKLRNPRVGQPLAVNIRELTGSAA